MPYCLCCAIVADSHNRRRHKHINIYSSMKKGNMVQKMYLTNLYSFYAKPNYYVIQKYTKIWQT